MSTKIFYNDNRIIIDGHADTPTECQAITAMCDSMANSENFKTIVYESGHAVFERVSGGEEMMFAAVEAQVAVLLQRVQALETRVSEIENGEYLSQYLSRNEASLLYETRTAHEASFAQLQTQLDQINSKIGYPDIENYGTIGDQLSNLNSASNDIQLFVEKALETAMKTDKRVDALEAVPKEALPYTAEEFTALLGKLESL